ncbi:hypothetical protein DTL42_00510 [Bremerella cremea]|uniref:Uncharacterized protein n=1 Tax=Bremerella cremea TaxID=1031537 RepID=A0A368KXN8_9BACT|nr:hypothetical protein [Bremerella cremea]RCS56098.1 hypothetical protein DTL42_00510 [Bremerella cremea]
MQLMLYAVAALTLLGSPLSLPKSALWTSIIQIFNEKGEMESGILKPKDIYSFSVSVPEKAKVGEPCIATVTITNIWSQNAKIPFHSLGPNLGASILDAKQNSVPRTEKARRLLLPENGWDYSLGLKELSPGQKLVWQVDLAECFELSPGRHTADFTHLLFIGSDRPIKFEIINSK